MKTKGNHPFPLPNSGAVLKFLIKCAGVPTKGAHGYNYKDLERLEKGGLAPETHERIARRVVDELVAAFSSDTASSSVTDDVLIEKDTQPLKYLTWQWDGAGQFLNLRSHLVRDLIEFIHRHQFLVERFGSGQAEAPVIFHWACTFVVPFLAVTLVEYQHNSSEIERGMPRGRFWYLPQLVPAASADDKPRIKLPMNHVLEWWQDLLGRPLESITAKLCLPDCDENSENPTGGHNGDTLGFDDERRQVRRWLTEDQLPSFDTIMRWCNREWRYQGIFRDDPSRNLQERWQSCRDFLVGKKLHQPGPFTRDALPDHTRRMFPNLRWERLELEIEPFNETPFALFFEEGNPLAAGLPVEELILKVAERYGTPSNAQLRSRLLLASVFQRAFRTSTEELGWSNTLQLLDWFSQVYCFAMDLHNRAMPASSDRVLAILRETPDAQGALRAACEWMFDPECWARLPAELSADFIGAKLGVGGSC